MGVGWASEEVSDLVGPPLNLVIYMYLRICTYTSNTLIASFEYMDSMLAAGTLKNFIFLLRSCLFLLRSCLFTERAPVMKIICLFNSPFNSLAKRQHDEGLDRNVKARTDGTDPGACIVA